MLLRSFKLAILIALYGYHGVMTVIYLSKFSIIREGPHKVSFSRELLYAEANLCINISVAYTDSSVPTKY